MQVSPPLWLKESKVWLMDVVSSSCPSEQRGLFTDREVCQQLFSPTMSIGGVVGTMNGRGVSRIRGSVVECGGRDARAPCIGDTAVERGENVPKDEADCPAGDSGVALSLATRIDSLRSPCGQHFVLSISAPLRFHDAGASHPAQAGRSA